MLGVDVSASLSLFKFKVVYSELAGQDIANNDFVFTLNEGGHCEFDKWESLDALLLFLELLGVIRPIK